MGEYEQQQAIYRELRDGDFRVRKTAFRMRDDQVTRFMRGYGIAAIVVFGCIGALAVLSINGLA